ncbi:MAG: hypothetical protein WBO10_00275 [Pyrinomonadaceae bacterium]
MLSARLFHVIIFLSFVTLLAACSDASTSRANLSTPPANSNPSADNSNSARNNFEELGLLINIPYEAEDVVWKENKEAKTLLAVLRFESADAAKFAADIEKLGQPQEHAMSPETWFPEELIAQSDMSGDNALKGKSYPAGSFLVETYKNGTITRIDGTDFFVLEAAAP